MFEIGDTSTIPKWNGGANYQFNKLIFWECEGGGGGTEES